MDVIHLLERCRAAEEECLSLQARADRLRASGVKAEILERRQKDADDRKALKAQDEQTAAVLIDALFGEDDRMRDVMWFFYIGRMTYNAISLKLHLSAGRIKNIKADATRLLQEPEKMAIAARIMGGDDGHGPQNERRGDAAAGRSTKKSRRRRT